MPTDVGSFLGVPRMTHMFIPTETTIITAVIGMIGILASGVVLTYGFVR